MNYKEEVLKQFPNVRQIVVFIQDKFNFMYIEHKGNRSKNHDKSDLAWKDFY